MSARRGVRRGTDRERQLRELLEADGWICARSAGSRGVADILAVRRVGAKLIAGGEPTYEPILKAMLVQVKSDAGSPWTHFGPAERLALLAAASKAGADCFLVWWPPDRKGPRWLAPADWPASVGDPRWAVT